MTDTKFYPGMQKPNYKRLLCRDPVSPFAFFLLVRLLDFLYTLRKFELISNSAAIHAYTIILYLKFLYYYALHINYSCRMREHFIENNGYCYTACVDTVFKKNQVERSSFHFPYSIVEINIFKKRKQDHSLPFFL